MGTLLLAFGVVFLAELGDKTQLVVLTLGARQHAVAVLASLALTIAVLQGIAVSVGASLAAVVPARAVEVAAGLLFLGFAVWTWRDTGRRDPDSTRAGRGGVLSVCFAFFLAELGDKTQLSAAALAADHGVVVTWVGATLGLFGATTVALAAGRVVTSRISARTLQRVGAGAFAAVGVLNLARAATSS